MKNKNSLFAVKVGNLTAKTKLISKSSYSYNLEFLEDCKCYKKGDRISVNHYEVVLIQ
ncbi:MAG: hypothetical protein AABY22_02590 [Nanoarchaeota archaeon]|mgnify:CR=1 FL=1